MNLENILYHATGSEIDHLSNDYVSNFEDELEDATDDQLRNWLLTQGITDAEIEQTMDQGLSLRDIVEDQVAYGNSFHIIN